MTVYLDQAVIINVSHYVINGVLQHVLGTVETLVGLSINNKPDIQMIQLGKLGMISTCGMKCHDHEISRPATLESHRLCES